MAGNSPRLCADLKDNSDFVINSEVTHEQLIDTVLFSGHFSFDSPYWSDKNATNLLDGKSGFDGNETKLPTYWNTPFAKICLGMKISQKINFAGGQLSVLANR